MSKHNDNGESIRKETLLLVEKRKKLADEKRKKQVAALSLVSKDVEKVGDETKNDADQPVQKFRKMIIKDGVYLHPDGDWTLDTDEDRRKKWVDAFDKMKANKVAIPIPIADDGNHHVVSPKNNGGFVVGMENKGDATFAILEMIGKDAIDAAGRNDVSVFIDPDTVDGEGRKYGEAITHVALTPCPIVPGLDGMIKIAASRSGDQSLTSATPYVYHAASLDKPNKGVLTMLTLDELKKLTGMGDELTEENALEKLGDRLSKDADSLTSKDEEITSLKLKVETGETKPAEVKLDADVEDGLVETGEARLDKLVADGKLTPDAKTKLAAALIGGKGKRNAYALSRTVSGHDRSVINQVCDAIDSNNPVELAKTLTGPQVLELSRPTPGASQTTEADKQTEDKVDDWMGLSKTKEPAATK